MSPRAGTHMFSRNLLLERRRLCGKLHGSDGARRRRVEILCHTELRSWSMIDRSRRVEDRLHTSPEPSIA